ncbi:hypothetical protein [Eikenella sp. Marseille-P7795]|uniref:hypothetical protein n=1 Tax=Eikenella sp. Marseille-P7795 TaxID=2866577 RepID=UPI001CE3F5CF|nr:hypothetical protein [Eikenella sp. Marseille-P7795]
MDKQQPSTPKPDPTIGAGSQHSPHLISRLKRFSPWLWSIAILIIIPYIIISWGYCRALILGRIQPSSYISFPLGQNKQVTLNKTFYLKHQYCVDMNIEFIDGMKKVFGEDYDKGNYIFNESADNIQRNFSGLDNNIKTQVYRFQVVAYNSNNIEIINKEYTNTNEVSNVWSGTITNDKNKSYLVEF